MKINVQKELDTYILTISYIVPAGLAETWNLLATDSGFVRWFPQLRVEGDKLVFEMEGFCEVMVLLDYREKPENCLHVGFSNCFIYTVSARKSDLDFF